jgi:receptor protein-tyrosine kinase
MNVAKQPMTPPARSIGAILIDNGRLSPDAAERILKLQKEGNLRFGDAAIQLGLLTEEDIQQALASQYDYPYLLPGDNRVSETVIAAFKPFSPVVEQLRALRSQLMLRWFDADIGHKALAITSAGNGEGRSFIAANLAVVFSQLGERTLLIDADLRNPSQHKLFCLLNSTGLSSVLSGRGEVAATIHRIPGLMDISVMTAGPKPPNPQELLSRPAFGSLIANLQEQYDIVVVDTSAGNETADVQTIASRTRGALVIARKDVTSAPQLQRLVTSLQHSGVTVVGSLLNNG